MRALMCAVTRIEGSQGAELTVSLDDLLSFV